MFNHCLSLLSNEGDKFLCELSPCGVFFLAIILPKKTELAALH